MEDSKKQAKTLLIVDMQNDFSPEGSLPVANFHKIIPRINSLMPFADLVIATQDWHTPDHISFHTSFENAKPFSSRFVNGNEQLLWPVHCVAGTWGAELDAQLDKGHINQTFRKGITRIADAYSAFHLNDGKTMTGLQKFLDPSEVELFVCGVATNVCVFNTVKSASELGYKTTVIRDLCAGLGAESEKKAFLQMESFSHVTVLDSEDLKSLWNNA